MKRKELTEIKNKKLADLRKLAGDKKSEARLKRMEIASGKSKNLKAFRNARRDLAQILTVIKEREIVEKLEAKELKVSKEKKKIE